MKSMNMKKAGLIIAGVTMIAVGALGCSNGAKEQEDTAEADMTVTLTTGEPTLTAGEPTLTAGITSQLGNAMREATSRPVTVEKKEMNVVTAAEEEEEVGEYYLCEEGTGYVNATTLNVRDYPSKGGNVVATLAFNTEVNYWTTEFKGWVAIGDDMYVASKYLSDEKASYKRVAATSNWRKSFESKNVFGRATNQQKLQNMASTDSKGFRVVGGRYCIAVGSAIGEEIGTYIDLVLENGTVIPCVMGDQKADCDTDWSNQRTSNGCVSEFIVDVNRLCCNGTRAGSLGDVSYANEGWNSRVKEFRIYEQNVLK